MKSDGKREKDETNRNWYRCHLGTYTYPNGNYVGIFMAITSTININQTEIDIFNDINTQRANMGLPMLGNDSDLTSTAVGWSHQLASMNTLTHGDFDSRMQSIGLPNTVYSCGEIIESFSSGSLNGVPNTQTASALATQFVNGWLNSPEHRAIMLTSANGMWVLV